ncbi:phage neck terminator protein [Bombella intestini]|nr:hypothetical protein [Bombella intestini]
MVPPDRHTPDSLSAKYQLTPTESTVMQLLGDWLKEMVLPADWDLFQGQQNRLPTPQTSYLIMQVTSRRPLATNNHNYTAERVTISQPVELTIQLTARGPDALTVLGGISTLWRDRQTVAWFQQKRNDIAPSDTGPLTQQDFTNAEQQYESSATLPLHLILMTSITRSTETATALGLASITEATTANFLRPSAP